MLAKISNRGTEFERLDFFFLFLYEYLLIKPQLLHTLLKNTTTNTKTNYSLNLLYLSVQEQEERNLRCLVLGVEMGQIKLSFSRSKIDPHYYH